MFTSGTTTAPPLVPNHTSKMRIVHKRVASIAPSTLYIKAPYPIVLNAQLPNHNRLSSCRPVVVEEATGRPCDTTGNRISHVHNASFLIVSLNNNRMAAGIEIVQAPSVPLGSLSVPGSPIVNRSPHLNRYAVLQIPIDIGTRRPRYILGAQRAASSAEIPICRIANCRGHTTAHRIGRHEIPVAEAQIRIPNRRIASWEPEVPKHIRQRNRFAAVGKIRVLIHRGNFNPSTNHAAATVELIINGAHILPLRSDHPTTVVGVQVVPCAANTQPASLQFGFGNGVILIAIDQVPALLVANRLGFLRGFRRRSPCAASNRVLHHSRADRAVANPTLNLNGRVLRHGTGVVSCISCGNAANSQRRRKRERLYQLSHMRAHTHYFLTAVGSHSPFAST